jgi:hypothetical protein
MLLTMDRFGGMRLAFVTSAAVLCARIASPQTAAPADDKEVCFKAVDEGQHQRTARKIVAARDQFIQCARSVCPALVRKDCAQWLSEVQVTLPSVVFGARDAHGNDVLNVRVSVDGNLVADKLDGTSVAVDPGPHVFHFEWEGHGAVDQQTVIREGEKSRLLTVSFSGGASGARPIPVGFWIFSALGLVGGAGFVGFAVSAEGDINHLRQTCAPACVPTDLDIIRSKIIVANVSLGVGIASVGVAAAWLLLTRGPEGKTTALHVEPTPGGGKASLAFTF